MNRPEFLELIDTVIEADPGTIKGGERLADLPRWDSLALLGFIATVDTHFRIQIPIDALIECKTVKDLEELLAGHITP